MPSFLLYFKAEDKEAQGLGVGPVTRGAVEFRTEDIQVSIYLPAP